MKGFQITLIGVFVFSLVCVLAIYKVDWNGWGHRPEKNNLATERKNVYIDFEMGNVTA